MRTPTTLLKDAWGIFTSNKQLFFGIYLVPAMIIFAFSFLFIDEEGRTMIFSVSDAVFFLALIVLMMISSVLMGVAMMKAASDPSGTTVGSAYSFAKKYFFPYIWVVFLTGLVTILGFIALIVPGIIFAVWFSFGYFVLVFEDKRGVDALKTSKSYVKGKWWAVLGRFLFIGFILLLVSIFTEIATAVLETGLENVARSIIGFILNAIITPISIAYIYLLYKDASSNTAESPVQSVQQEVAGAM